MNASLLSLGIFCKPIVAACCGSVLAGQSPLRNADEWISEPVREHSHVWQGLRIMRQMDAGRRIGASVAAAALMLIGGAAQLVRAQRS